jgi:hypothetical protein
METIRVAATTKFTSEMEKLRRTGFHNSSPETSSCDEFDTLSIHVLAIIRDEIVGMIRLTLKPPSVLQTWSGWKAPFPHGEGVIDVTRGIVAKQWRGFDIYKLLMTETMIKAKVLGAKTAVAPIEPHFQHRIFLSNIGFQNAAEPLNFNHPPIGETVGQCLVQHPQKDFGKVIEVRTKIINGERMKNFRVVSTIKLR